jgi:hypothetical protein
VKIEVGDEVRVIDSLYTQRQGIANRRAVVTGVLEAYGYVEVAFGETTAAGRLMARMRAEDLKATGRNVLDRWREEVDEAGLTPAEAAVSEALAKAYSGYLGLPVQHPEEQDEFRVAFHRLQELLAMRVVRREYPKGWPTIPGGTDADPRGTE